MPQIELQEVFHSTTLASLMHAVPAWWGFTLAEDRNRLNSFLNKSKKAGFYQTEGPSFEVMVDQTEQDLFKTIQQDQSCILICLRKLITPTTSAPEHILMLFHRKPLPLQTKTFSLECYLK